MSNVNTSRELQVGQRVTVLIDAEVTEIPKSMDYHDTVVIRDMDSGLLVRVRARALHPTISCA